ncbi:MAG: NDP-sugar synthase [Desulfobacteraceae bacterium]|jgi:NDP-sugar pyrophosphorylase family protein|nr:MAG: NDP-sugar synthase [Desulfobacteraceae bacterium]
MKAMILAAGLGTRLHPLTGKRPKALVPVMNRPMILWVMEHLKTHGVDQIVVNAHHHARMLLEYLSEKNNLGLKVQVRLESEILGTGGGIRNTADFWDGGPFIVANGDTLSDIDLTAACKAHTAEGSLATLIVHDRPDFGKIQIDGRGRITDISRDVIPDRLAFTGIHIMDPAIFDYIRPGVFSDIIDCYRELIREGKPPLAFVSKGHRWHDVGTPESYLAVHGDLAGDRGLILGQGCRMDESAGFVDWAVVGDRAILEAGTELIRSVIWEDVHIRQGVRITDSVISSGSTVEKDIEHGVI